MYFSQFFKGFQLPEIVSAETAPLSILTIKRGPLCNFGKAFIRHHFMGQSSMDLKFSITIEFYILKSFFGSLLENFEPILDLKQGVFFFLILLYVQRTCIL